MMGAIESETHKRLLAVLARGQADQDTLAGRLSPGERAAPGEPHAWSAKDHVAHNNFWRQDAVLRLQAALDGSEPPDTEQSDEQTLLLNDRVFHEQRGTPWEELVMETARLRADTAALIHRFAAEDLTQKARYPWQNGSLEALVFINWYDHPAEHWADIYLSRNGLDRALELRQAVVATVRELFPHDPKLYSYMVYKLGGMYARNGRPEQAVSAIRDAVATNRSLIEWARQDTDLESLRTLPAFQALYENSRRGKKTIDGTE
jgi:tetratricopeptide (TPR) repeat protein